MRHIFAFVLASLFACTANAQTQVERDFDTFVRWFSGSWDNEIQTFNENYEKVPDDERHNRIHMVYTDQLRPAVCCFLRLWLSR